MAESRHNRLEQLQLLTSLSSHDVGNAGDVAPRSRETGGNPGTNGWRGRAFDVSFGLHHAVVITAHQRPVSARLRHPAAVL